MNPRCQKTLHLKFQTDKKFTHICLTCSFLLVTPRVNDVAVAAWENISQGDCALSTSDVTIMMSLLYKFLREQRNKFPTKRIFRILDILKTSRKTTFCNLFIERPSYIKLSHFPSVLICLHVVVLNENKNNAVAYPPSRLRKTQRGAMNPPCPHTEIATTLSFSGRLGRRHD